MKRASAALLLAATLVRAQYTVTTVAGGAIPSGIPAQNAPVGAAGITRDALGNTYLCYGVIQRIRPGGIIETFAGTERAGYSGDGGPALSAELSGPEWCAMDRAGNLIFSDSGNARIRRIDPSGIITTIVGTGIRGSLGDGGPGVTAQIGYLTGIVVDGLGNVYFSDDSYIRRLTPAGIVERIAGSDQSELTGSNGDGGSALAAVLAPHFLTIDAAGNLYFSDPYSSATVRRITTDGIVSTVAGGQYNYPVQDGMPATSGYLASVSGLAADSAGDLYIGVGSFIRRVDGKTGTITTVAGTNGAGAIQAGACAMAERGRWLGFDSEVIHK